MSTPNERDVIFDWNVHGASQPARPRRVLLVDETMRDGVQCPSVTDPPIDAKLQMLRLMARVGVDCVDIGLPGAGPRAVADVTRLAELIRDEKLPIQPNCAARTHANDITPVLEITQKTGVMIEVMAFLGASPIRLYAEGWDVDLLEKRTRDSIRQAKTGGHVATFVTEDTTRAHPDTLRRLFLAAIEEGADGLCLCDTCGHSTDSGVRNLIAFTRGVIAESGRDVRIDWHGHHDRGLGLSNALAACEAGADRVHGCVLGVGERVGNTSLDQLLVNLKLMGWHDGDLTSLGELVDLTSSACQVPIPVSYPVFGKDAFRTGTGVHAAAVIKALNKGADWLADRVYSGVPAGWFGRHQVIEIGHMAGDSNIVYWLRHRGFPTSDALISAIRTRAKSTSRVLEEQEILDVIASVSA
ncbi:MAG: 2-isopropylmalate synthase [Myxococcales bacterium]|nr:2-isopropylmalate synthase [Myxococcales bacterium]